MPTASRNERRKRRQRRNISLLTREVRSLNARHFNASVSLLGVLKASGGSVTVPKDVAAELMQEYHLLKWEAKRQDNGDVVVALIAPAKTEDQGDQADAQADPVVGERSVTAQLGRQMCPGDGCPGCDVCKAIETGADYAKNTTPVTTDAIG